MAPAKSSIRGFLKEVEAVRQQRGRNTLAAWFRAHHDELLAQLGGRQIAYSDGNQPVIPIHFSR